uniref:hypothetical protein n=1 Tax=Nonomuraea pusilla TaxID=46177 RepID=UPI000B108950|nr:hypothetical protein [Nonomuraea pusilla]
MPFTRPPRRVRAALPALLALPSLLAVPAVAASGPAAPEGTLSIRLLEIPANRVDDVRAQRFIVDHVNPGTTFTRRLELRSTSDRPQQVQVYAAAAGIDQGRFTFAPERAQNELTSWIRLDRPAVTLPPNGSARVRATVAVPAGASRQERYAVIWAQTAAPPGAGAGISVVNRVGIRVYLDVGPGGEPPSDFRVSEVVPQRTGDGRPALVARVANTGQRALDLDGTLMLTGGPSSLSAGPFPVGTGTTLAPGGQADVTVVTGADLPDGPWRFRLELASGWVERTAEGTLTFPARAGSRGLPAALDGPAGRTTVAAVLVAGLAGAAAWIVRGRLRARRARFHRPS